MKGRGRRRHQGPPDPAGILLVDKAQEWTSHDVVNLLRRRFHFNKVGHCGTLDPLATGLLVMVIGKATRLSQHLTADDKTYATELELGYATDSHDITGEKTEESDFSHVSEEQVRECLQSFLGEQEQVPPMVSAIKKKGKKLYELARQGIEVEREARPITLHTMDDISIELPKVGFNTRCSKGTYIRVLCHDIGLKLGTHATMSALRRTACGAFNLEMGALTLEQLKTMEREDVLPHLIPMEKIAEIAQAELPGD